MEQLFNLELNVTQLHGILFALDRTPTSFRIDGLDLAQMKFSILHILKREGKLSDDYKEHD
jgi:hypothetical protein